MLSEADERRAFERLERAWRTGDAEAQLIILQQLARYWWRLAELKRMSDRVNNSAYLDRLAVAETASGGPGSQDK